MKLIIDINDNEYVGIKEYPNNITSYPVTIHIYDAIQNGIPLEKVKAEIEQDGAYYQEIGEKERANAYLEVLSTIDKCIEGK